MGCRCRSKVVYDPREHKRRCGTEERPPEPKSKRKPDKGSREPGGTKKLNKNSSYGREDFSI